MVLGRQLALARRCAMAATPPQWLQLFALLALAVALPCRPSRDVVIDAYGTFDLLRRWARPGPRRGSVLDRLAMILSGGVAMI